MPFNVKYAVSRSTGQDEAPPQPSDSLIAKLTEFNDHVRRHGPRSLWAVFDQFSRIKIAEGDVNGTTVIMDGLKNAELTTRLQVTNLGQLAAGTGCSFLLCVFGPTPTSPIIAGQWRRKNRSPVKPLMPNELLLSFDKENS